MAPVDVSSSKKRKNPAGWSRNVADMLRGQQSKGTGASAAGWISGSGRGSHSARHLSTSPRSRDVDRDREADGELDVDANINVNAFGPAAGSGGSDFKEHDMTPAEVEAAAQALLTKTSQDAKRESGLALSFPDAQKALARLSKTAVEVKPDGNCLVSSLQRGLPARHPMRHLSAFEARRRIAAHARSLSEADFNFLANDDVSFEGREDWLRGEVEVGEGDTIHASQWLSIAFLRLFVHAAGIPTAFVYTKLQSSSSSDDQDPSDGRHQHSGLNGPRARLEVHEHDCSLGDRDAAESSAEDVHALAVIFHGRHYSPVFDKDSELVRLAEDLNRIGRGVQFAADLQALAEKGIQEEKERDRLAREERSNMPKSTPVHVDTVVATAHRRHATREFNAARIGPEGKLVSEAAGDVGKRTRYVRLTEEQIRQKRHAPARSVNRSTSRPPSRSTRAHASAPSASASLHPQAVDHEPPVTNSE